ncbi:MAG: hypothetical protein AAGF12_23170 [Myxococcota bacterium]
MATHVATTQSKAMMQDKKMNLEHYVSSGAFLESLRTLLPQLERLTKTCGSDEINERNLQAMAEKPRAELLAFKKIMETEGVPELGSFTPYYGHNLEWDLGNELKSWFEPDDQVSIKLARGAIGIGDNGGGLMFYALPDGGVAAMDLGATYDWQWSRFENLGTCLWTLVHAAAVTEGQFDKDEFHRIVLSLNVSDAAVAFDVDEDLLPDAPDDGSDAEMPGWLK